MIIRQIDAQNDWMFGHGLTNYAQDEAAIEENVKTRLLSWVGDCFFALQEGVDWRNRLDTGQQAALLDEAKSVILASFGVISVGSVEGIFDPLTRNFALTYKDVQTIFSRSFQDVIQQSAGVS